jgi:hypothetical protein
VAPRRALLFHSAARRDWWGGTAPTVSGLQGTIERGLADTHRAHNRMGRFSIPDERPRMINLCSGRRPLAAETTRAPPTISAPTRPYFENGMVKSRPSPALRSFGPYASCPSEPRFDIIGILLLLDGRETTGKFADRSARVLMVKFPKSTRRRVGLRKRRKNAQFRGRHGAATALPDRCSAASGQFRHSIATLHRLKRTNQ